MNIRSLLPLLLLLSVLNRAQDTLTILHVNDTHSSLAAGGPRGASLEGSIGGIARAASIVGYNRLTEPHVLFLHAGDSFIGDIFFNYTFGAGELMLLQQLGIDAMALGNHEFDLTPAVLWKVLDTLRYNGVFPAVSSNTGLDSFPPLQPYVFPHLIKTCGSTKVGIFSLLTKETSDFSMPAPVTIDTAYTAVAAREVQYLSAQGCNVIICLSHLGNYQDHLLAAAVPGITAIIGGHDHLMLNQPETVTTAMGTTLITQADAFYTHIGKLQLVVNGSTVSRVNYELIALDSNVPEEPSVKAAVSQLIAGIEAQWGVPFFTQAIASASADFDEVADFSDPARNYSTSVGNLVTDAFRAHTNTEIAMEAGGSTSRVIWHGPVVPADLFRAIGYGFNESDGLGYRLVTGSIKGSDLYAGLEIGVSPAPYSDEFLPQVSGMEYGFNTGSPAGQRVQWVLVNGQPLDTARYYTITMNEFLEYALSTYNIYLNNRVLDSAYTEFRALLEYAAAHPVLTPTRSGRVTRLAPEGPQQPQQYRLEQNYPNPFNPVTSIRFTMPYGGTARVTVYNCNGELVTTLCQSYLPAGVHEVLWRPENCPSGIYLCVAELGNTTFTKKMAFIK